MKLKLEQRDDGWWIVNVPDESCQEMGPYKTRAEADDERRGCQRTIDANPEIWS